MKIVNKITAFIKARPFISLIITAIVLAILYSVLTYKKTVAPEPGKSPLPSGGPTVQAPETSFPENLRNEEDFKKEFGEPLTEKKQGENTVATYKSKSPTTPHEVVFDKAGQVVFFRDIVAATEYRNALEIRRVYGDPTVLYSKYGTGGLQLLSYPEKGIAWVGLDHDKTMLEIWYFKSMTEDSLLKTWGKDYLKNPPTEQVYY